MEFKNSSMYIIPKYLGTFNKIKSCFLITVLFYSINACLIFRTVVICTFSLKRFIYNLIIPHVKIVNRDWLTKVGHSIMSIGEMSTVLTDSAVIVVFIDILPNWGLFGIKKQICHVSVGILMECFPSGGWLSLMLCPREKHPPSGRHYIRIPTLAWHICIKYIYIHWAVPKASRYLHCGRP